MQYYLKPNIEFACLILKHRSFIVQVILCGEYGAGKTSLFRRFSSNVFVKATDRASTLGLDHFGKVYKVGTEENSSGKEIKLQLWDTGGMERVASITSSYYKYSEAAILVFALDKKNFDLPIEVLYWCFTELRFGDHQQNIISS